MDPTLLELRNLCKHYGGRRDIFGRRRQGVKAVDGVSLAVARGSTLGVVGESGCGKSTLARMLVGLMAPTSGDILFDGENLVDTLRRDRLAFRRKVQMVFQDPMSALNPRKTIKESLEAPLVSLLGMGRDARASRVVELMELVSLRPEFLDRYPHEFSGGQCQRIGIARALAAEPELLVLDEPVSALDVSVQAQILKLLKTLQARLGLTYVFISHDLAVVENLCDQVVVMYFGRVVERGPREELFGKPQHDYTKLLLSSVPVPGQQTL
ncbi:MAG TPA: ATP-binding cassette domain-containing protein [Kiloniellaceae bacterium]|nr:ATP-binding cassette domain-containing protein [Kiloniellaceae bacterium]